jgi:hypothetical protein
VIEASLGACAERNDHVSFHVTDRRVMFERVPLKLADFRYRSRRESTNVSGTSTKSAPKTRAKPEVLAVLEPTRFLADIFMLRRSLVGEWLVAQYDEDHIGQPLIDDFGFTGRDYKSVQSLNEATRLRSSAAEAVQILNRGSFRRAHWVRIKTALSSGIPDEVKEAIREFRLSEDARIYLVRAEQLRLDLELLACLAQLTTALQSNRWTEAKKQVGRGRKLFDLVSRMDFLPQDPGRSTVFDDEGTEPKPQFRPPETPERKRSGGPSATRAEADTFLTRAFDRGLGTMEAKYWSHGTKSAGLQLRTTSFQATLYLTLLAKSHGDWQECKLSGCYGIFQRKQKSGRLQEYCDQKCAHKGTMRAKRAKLKLEREKVSGSD